MKRKMIAYCGLDCEKCDAYIATINDDDELRKKVAALWSKFNHILITPDQINCEGCRGVGKKTMFCSGLCQIRKCAMEKRFETCGDCKELESCEKVDMILSSDKEALENLKS